MATFELVDGDLLKEYLWNYDEEEKGISVYILSTGYDSRLFQFTFGFPLYVFVYSLVLVTALSIP
jgi:hypothetical protein